MILRYTTFLALSICFGGFGQHFNGPKQYYDSISGEPLIALAMSMDADDHVWVAGNIQNGFPMGGGDPYGFFLTEQDQHGEVIESYMIDLDMFATSQAGLRQIVPMSGGLLLTGNVTADMTFIWYFDCTSKQITWQKNVTFENVHFSSALSQGDSLIYWSYSNDSAQVVHQLNQTGDFNWSKSFSAVDTSFTMPYLLLKGDSSLILSGSLEDEQLVKKAYIDINLNTNSSELTVFDEGKLGQGILKDGSIYFSAYKSNQIGTLIVSPQNATSYMTHSSVDYSEKNRAGSSLCLTHPLNDSLILFNYSGNLSMEDNLFQGRSLLFNLNNPANSIKSQIIQLVGMHPYGDTSYLALRNGPEYGIKREGLQLEHFAIGRFRLNSYSSLGSSCFHMTNFDFFPVENLTVSPYPINENTNFPVINPQTFAFSNLSLTNDDDCVSGFGNLQENQLANISLAPNPVEDYFVIESDQAIESLSILNMRGQIIEELRFSSVYSTQVQSSDLLDGVYLLSIKTERGVVVKRFEKK